MRLDRLYTISLRSVARMIMAWLDKAQHREPETLIASTGIAFLALCERFDVPPRRALEVAERVLRDAQDKQPAEIRALRAYLQNEL